MSISGMSDLLETPDGLDDRALTEDLIGDNDQDEEDSSLLDAALGDVSEVDKDLAITPTEEQSDAILDEASDSLQVEDTEEIEDLKARVKEMEEEAEKLKEIQGEVEKQMMSSAKSPTSFPTPEEKMDADNRSVYVGNVDYQSTAEELGQHFQGCGAINRVTILCDKFTGHPKGFAYIEFIDKISITQALDLDDSLFKGRQIKVSAKRTNRPGVSTTNRGTRGRGRGRGGFRGAYNPYMGGMMMMPMPAPMGYYRGGRGRAFRGRAKSNWYAPY